MPQHTFPVLLLAAVIGSNAYCAEPPPQDTTPAVAGSSFYQDKERGWFWYEDPPPEEMSEGPKPPLVEPPPAASEHAPAPASAPKAPGSARATLPPTGSVAWLRVMLPKLRDAAMDNPSRENMEAYYYAQRIMLDKAERFSRSSVETIRNDPFLDEDMRYPASNAAADALATASGRQRDSLMHDIAKSSALVFFYRGLNCLLCEQALSAVSALEFRYGFKVMPVSMDGHPMPNGKYPNTKYDTGLAEKLGVMSTPALAIAIPPNDVKVIAFSTVSMDTTTSRILIAAKDAGLITEQELNSTSRINNMGLVDSQRLNDLPPDVTAKPQAFIDRVREEAKRAFQDSVGGGK